VVCVNWDDAISFTTWLSKKTQMPYRLLAEAEREYVTRAGKTSTFWWGSTISPTQANYDTREAYGGEEPKGEWRQNTLPVDSFKPNPWGLYQVHGNVFEWVEDCYTNSYNGAPSDGSAWLTGDCSHRVLRGGSWASVPRLLRAAYRYWNTTSYRFASRGFRVARALQP